MEKKIIAVVGATGLQGKGVVDALKKNGSFNKIKKKSKNCEYIDIITSNNENTNIKIIFNIIV